MSGFCICFVLCCGINVVRTCNIAYAVRIAFCLVLIAAHPNRIFRYTPNLIASRSNAYGIELQNSMMRVVWKTACRLWFNRNWRFGKQNALGVIKWLRDRICGCVCVFCTAYVCCLRVRLGFIYGSNYLANLIVWTDAGNERSDTRTTERVSYSRTHHICIDFVVCQLESAYRNVYNRDSEQHCILSNGLNFITGSDDIRMCTKFVFVGFGILCRLY